LGLGELAGAYGAVAAAALQAWKKIMDGVQAAKVAPIHAMGQFASAVANPDANPATSLQAAGAAASKFGDTMLYVVPPLGVLASAAGAAANELGQFMKAMDGLVQRYGQYSGPVTAAESMAEIRQTIGDIRRSREIAPDLVRYINAKSEMQEKFEEIKIKLLKQITPFAEILMKQITAILANTEFQLKGIETLQSLMPTDLVRQIRDILGKNDAEPVLGPTDLILGPNFNKKDWDKSNKDFR
jgi:hypothetical protein